MLKKNFKTSGLRFLWLSLLIFMVDWGTKALANTYLDPYVPLPVFPFFNLTLAYNTGAAFSFLSSGFFWSNILFGVIAFVVSLFILGWLYRLPRHESLIGLGLALILGGALGNLWDRIRYEHVIDFVDLYVSNWHWPVFNVADVAVSLGAFLIIWKWMVIKK
jgi:signal peptidase II